MHLHATDGIARPQPARQSEATSQTESTFVPDAVSDIEAALVEPAAVTFHAVRRTAAEHGAIVVVQGAGPIGLLTAQHARNAGAGHLIVSEPSATFVRRGGTLSLLGFPLTESTVSYGDWQQRELRVVSSLAYNHEDFVGAIRSIASGRVDVTPLHTGTYALGELATVLEELDSGTSSHAKVLISPSR